MVTLVNREFGDRSCLSKTAGAALRQALESIMNGEERIVLTFVDCSFGWLEVSVFSLRLELTEQIDFESGSMSVSDELFF